VDCEVCDRGFAINEISVIFGVENGLIDVVTGERHD
jgi:hypothetical protein